MKKSGVQVLQTPRAKVRKGSDPAGHSFKGLAYGGWGSGKSFIVKALLEQGYKVFVLTTDIGGSGMNSVKLPLRREGKAELLDNLYELVLTDYSEIQEFFINPTKYFPEIYDVDPDFLIWDGFGSWQQVEVSEMVGEIGPPSKEVSAPVESGLFFEQSQWGMVRNATYRGLSHFCGMHNVKTGKVWHKWVTCQEGTDGTPMIQGAAGKLIGGAFDLIIRCKVTTDPQTGKKDYTYKISADNPISKLRGFVLEPSMKADMGKLWPELASQLGLTKDAKDETLVLEQSS